MKTSRDTWRTKVRSGNSSFPEGSTTIRKFGILAEDLTDVDVIKTIVRRILGVASFKHFAADGCAKIKVKAERWMRQFAQHGHTEVIIVHDLDRDPRNGQLRDYRKLHGELTAIRSPPGITKLVCIPVEEMEAWFWADAAVVQHVGRGAGQASASPENIPRPKESRIRLSIAGNGKPRYSTLNNPQLAAMLDLNVCAARCESFQSLANFLGLSTRK